MEKEELRKLVEEEVERRLQLKEEKWEKRMEEMIEDKVKKVEIMMVENEIKQLKKRLEKLEGDGEGEVLPSEAVVTEEGKGEESTGGTKDRESVTTERDAEVGRSGSHLSEVGRTSRGVEKQEEGRIKERGHGEGEREREKRVEEWKERDRKWRRRNVIVRGWRAREIKDSARLLEILEEKMGMELRVEEIRKIGQEGRDAWIRFESEEMVEEIWEKKEVMRRWGIYLDPDLMREERRGSRREEERRGSSQKKGVEGEDRERRARRYGRKRKEEWKCFVCFWFLITHFCFCFRLWFGF